MCCTWSRPTGTLLRVEQQDVGGHQHRVHEQAGGDAGVVVLAFAAVAVDRRLVGVRAIEQALAGDAGQQPGQFRNLRDVGLAVEPHLLRIQPAGQPAAAISSVERCTRAGSSHLDQRVVVGEEIEALDAGRAAGGDRRADRADVVAQVRRAGGGDAGEDAGGSHERCGARSVFDGAVYPPATPFPDAARFHAAFRPENASCCATCWCCPRRCSPPPRAVRCPRRPLVDLDVIDRDSGQWLPELPYRGERWIAGAPGHRYSVRLTNRTGERVLVVLSVDGVNAVSGQTADAVAGRLRARPVGERRDHRLAQVAGRCRAVRLHRPARLLRRAHRPAGQRRRHRHRGVPRSAADRVRADRGCRRRGMEDSRGNQAPQAKAAAPPQRRESAAADSAYGGVAQQRIGTGHGAREWSPVGQTGFERASSRPAQVTQLRYDDVATLAALGSCRARRPGTCPPGIAASRSVPRRLRAGSAQRLIARCIATLAPKPSPQIETGRVSFPARMRPCRRVLRQSSAISTSRPCNPRLSVRLSGPPF